MLDKLINIVNSKIKYSARIDNRELVATICLLYLNSILEYANTPDDRRVVNDLICKVNRQINTGNPMKLDRIYYGVCNCCNNGLLGLANTITKGRPFAFYSLCLLLEDGMPWLFEDGEPILLENLNE